MSVHSDLQQFGLSEKEIAIYLASLALGAASVQQIASQAKMNRVSSYDVIDGLVKKGFLKEVHVGKKRQIAPYSPTKLYDVVTKRQDEVNKQIRLLDALVPKLKKNMAADVTKTNIIYYEGEEGLRNWASDALETKGELLEWTKIESFSKRFDEYLKTYYFPEKTKRQIPTRFIFLDTDEARAYVQENYMKKQAPPMKARFIPPDQFETPGFMAIFNDRYSISIPSEMRAVTVVDQLIADAQRKMFEFGWQFAKDEMQNKKYPIKL